MTQSPHEDPKSPTREELGHEVDEARHELGKTVEALAAKADVKARAHERATELKEQVGTRVAVLSDEVKAAAQVVQEKLPAPVKERAAAAGEQLSASAGRLWRDKAPDAVRDRVARGARSAREHSTVLFAVAGATGAWLLLRRRDRRRR
ncbi:DUF3618 domain-containing protein [Streptomyces sp. NPDC006530]|uniref:DUF3618 domain-containing protein n=1 Tax=Streptomyces sp. NPDC006530 TaxID=3364750 RepID=UPI0036AD04B5